jgi:hypothetical protein
LEVEPIIGLMGLQSISLQLRPTPQFLVLARHFSVDAAVNVSVEVVTFYLAATFSIRAREYLVLAHLIMNLCYGSISAHFSTKATLMVSVGAVFLQMLLKLFTKNVSTVLWAGN